MSYCLSRFGFISTLRHYMADVDLSRDVMKSFGTAPGRVERIPDGVEIFVNVLTAGYWRGLRFFNPL
jgi:hypothetical protein